MLSSATSALICFRIYVATSQPSFPFTSYQHNEHNNNGHDQWHNGLHMPLIAIGGGIAAILVGLFSFLKSK